MSKEHRVFDANEYLWQEIIKRGGFVNAHAHLDRAYTVDPTDPQQLALAREMSVQDKWFYVRDIKEKSSVDDIYSRMCRAFEDMKLQGVSAIGTFIDVDSFVKDKGIKAASRAREAFQGDLKIVYVNQTLEGVLDDEANRWFYEGAWFADIVGSLPGRDKGREEAHLDVVLGTAKDLGKMAHIHADQCDNPGEKETEMVIDKIEQFGMQNRTSVIHGISIAAHHKAYREWIYRRSKHAGLMFVSCPNAWIDRKRNENMVPTHNSLTPIDEMIPAGVVVAVGTDNIADIYCPFISGNIREEIGLMQKGNRFYDINELVNIATIYGKRALGLYNTSEDGYDKRQFRQTKPYRLVA